MSRISTNLSPMGYLEIAAAEDPHTGVINKFGRNAATAAGDGIWINSGAFPSVDGITPGTAIVKSSQGADNGATATGALTVQVLGLDANKLLQDEIVTLNGTANVTTSGSYSRIYRMQVLTAGSGDVPAGNITATVGGVELAQCLAGVNQTEQAWYTIPSNMVGLITKMRSSFANTSNTRSADIELICTISEDSNVLTPLTTMSMVTIGSSWVETTFDPPFRMSPGIDVMLRCKAISAESIVHGSFDMYLLKR